jgi:hypothetical protein
LWIGLGIRGEPGIRQPIGTTVAALIFGVFQALSTILQVRTNLRTDPLLALPYVVTVAALAFAGLRTIRQRTAAPHIPAWTPWPPAEVTARFTEVDVPWCVSAAGLLTCSPAADSSG